MDFPKDVAYDQFTNQLDNLKELTKEDNEAKTRLLAIDTIIFTVLSWNKLDVDVEKYCRNGFADYVFSSNEVNLLVLEAKKSKADFLLQGENYTDRPYLFGLLAKECPAAVAALSQAISYAATLGTRYVAISNGHQWLFTLTFVRGQAIEKRLVYIFESFEAIGNKFTNFCSCFCQEALLNNAAYRNLLDKVDMPAPAKLSSQIPSYPEVSQRNIYQCELTTILDYVWEVMAQYENSETFVKRCYVNPNSHHDILTIAQELIEKRKNEDDLISKYDVESIDELADKLAHLPAEKPFIILGEVGRGKSSFLKYLRFIGAKKLLKIISK